MNLGRKLTTDRQLCHSHQGQGLNIDLHLIPHQPLWFQTPLRLQPSQATRIPRKSASYSFQREFAKFKLMKKQCRISTVNLLANLVLPPDPSKSPNLDDLRDQTKANRQGDMRRTRRNRQNETIASRNRRRALERSSTFMQL